MHFRSFLKIKVQDGNIFWGLLIFQIFWEDLLSLNGFNGNNSWLMGDSG